MKLYRRYLLDLVIPHSNVFSWARTFGVKSLSLFAVLSLFACSGGTQQNPLVGQPENVKQGVPPESKPKEDRNPVPREAMRLEIEPELPSFVEGQESQLTIKADILGFLDQDFVVEIKNLPEGATYDANTGQLTWKPKLDTVIGDNYMEIYSLTVQMSTVKRPVLSIIRQFPLYVQRDSPRPEILKVNIPSEVVEGQQEKISVIVKDLDSADDNLAVFGQPHLTIVQIKNSSHDGSSLVSLSRPTWNDTNPHRMDKDDPDYDKNLWVFDLVIDTRNKELTSSRDIFNFGLIATSRFGLASAEAGVPSDPRVVNIPIISKVPKAITTWPDEVIKINEGEKSIFSFDVYSPMAALSFRGQPEGDGYLDPIEIKENCNPNLDLAGKAECKCIKAKSWRYQCTFTWTPDSTMPPPLPSSLQNLTISVSENTYPIAFRAINRNPYRTTDMEVSEFVKLIQFVKSN
ncbi:MAG: hypothetical protein KDD35_06055 [Bdellovibrionales bacterium]|nr:hypothetical protein [Bdellovibrionales bacterium]